MAGTFSQIYIQIVFAVQNRESMIQASWEDDLYKYITGIVRNKEQKMLAINGMPDHIHFFIGMKPSCCLSDLVREVKKSSNDFIKEKKFSKFKFNWQEGYGAFSYSHSQIDSVIKYIMNQKVNHKKQTFREEYFDFLEKFGIGFKDEYLFKWIEQRIRRIPMFVEKTSGILYDPDGVTCSLLRPDSINIQSLWDYQKKFLRCLFKSLV